MRTDKIHVEPYANRLDTDLPVSQYMQQPAATNMRHHHHMPAGGNDGANAMLIERDNSGDNASHYAQMIDDESKHCTSIDDKVVSSRWRGFSPYSPCGSSPVNANLP